MTPRYWLFAAAAFLGLWGISWCLPNAERVAAVLPPGTDSPQFRDKIKASWLELHQRLGEDILLHPEAYSPGFHDVSKVPAGWIAPPEQLLNSARSFYLRSGHEDESDILFALSRIKPWRLEFNPHIYFYGGAYLYPLGAWIALASTVTPAKLKSDVGFYLEHPNQIAWIYLLGRLFSAVCYVVTILILMLVGKKFFSPTAGFVAAALYATAPGIVLQTHYMKPHLLGGMFVLLAFYFCCCILKEECGVSRWLFAGAMVGLAGGCAINFWNASALVGLTLIFRIRQGHPWKPEFRAAVLSGAAALGAYTITNPFWITDFPSFWQGTRAIAAFSSPTPANIVRFALIGLPAALTWPSYACVLAGLFRKKNLEDPVRALASVSVLGLMLMAWIYLGTDKLDAVRYFGGVGIGFMLAGAWLSDLGQNFKYLFMVPVLYAGIYSLFLDYNLHLDATGQSTRQKAGAWIEQNISAGSELGLLRLPQPSNSPYFQWNRYRLKFIEPQVLETWKIPAGDLPGTLILTSPSYNDQPRIEPVLRENYILTKAFPQASWGPFSFRAGDIYGNPLIEIYSKIKRAQPPR